MKTDKLTVLQTINNLIKAQERGIQKGLEAAGEKGVENMRRYAEDFTATGRLYNGISWATKSNVSNMSEDAVPTPEESNKVNVGTSVPYASSVDNGYAFATGYNGQNISVTELAKRIYDWSIVKGIASENREAFSIKVAKNLIENGHDAQPFFNNSMSETIWDSIPIIDNLIAREFLSIKEHSTQVIKLDIKL